MGMLLGSTTISINFTYDDNNDTITVVLQFANAEDENTIINFPLVFYRTSTAA